MCLSNFKKYWVFEMTHFEGISMTHSNCNRGNIYILYTRKYIKETHRLSLSKQIYKRQ